MGVVGKVGSGKSSLLAAITAEMRKKDGQVSVTLNMVQGRHAHSIPLTLPQISVADLSHGFGLASQVSALIIRQQQCT